VTSSVRDEYGIPWIATAVIKNSAARESGPDRPNNDQHAELSDQKRSTAIATAATSESAKISRREGFTSSPLVGIFAG
jgi:hypothetical protein